MEQMILQTELPFRAWEDPVLSRLPGTQPLSGLWLRRDEAFAGQMAARAGYLAERRAAGVMLDDSARSAACELLERVLAELALDAGYVVGADSVLRPDGVSVSIDRDDPLGTLALLVQEDLCLLDKRGDEHVLVGAVLLFPAFWRLVDKFMQPMMAIHAPVHEYTADLGRRVQRMFDLIRPEMPVWRANWLTYDNARLWQAPLEPGAPPRARPAPGTGYLRSERQTILRLPQTGVMVFSIHTYLWDVAALPADARESLTRAGQR
jgi:hypothetical protein